MNDDIHGLVGAYATDALDDAEHAAFEAHLASCPDCRADLAGFREVLGAVAGAHPVVPPAGLEDVIVAAATGAARTPEIGAAAPAGPARASGGGAARAAGPGAAGSTRDDERASGATALPLARRRRTVTWLAAAAAAAVFAGGVLVGRQTVPTEPVAADAASVVAVASAEDAHFLPVDIMGTETRVVISDEMGKTAFLASDLPMPAKGMCYQVWRVSVDGQMVSAGAFTPDADGHVAVVLEGGTEGVTKYMVTMEPPGGSEHPTGEMLAEVTT